MRKKGTWAKLVGGDYGAVFNGKTWEAFECLWCAKYHEIIKYPDKIGIGSVWKYVDNAVRRGWVHKCSGAEIHKKYLETKNDYK